MLKNIDTFTFRGATFPQKLDSTNIVQLSVIVLEKFTTNYAIKITLHDDCMA